MTIRELSLAAILSLALIIAIAAATNRLDIANHAWDFTAYIAMAEHGFAARPLISPFAYRYPTPFIAGGLSSLLGISLEAGFRVIAYLGAFLQLVGAFCFVRLRLAPAWSAYVAILVLAFSFAELRFLMFDVYRPDHLAYGFIILALYFSLTDRFHALLVTAMIGVQFREFVLLPLLAHLIWLAWRGEWAKLLRHAPAVALGLSIAILLPRLLIPVTESVQAVSGLHAIIAAPLIVKRDLNLLFCALAYFLPSLMLATPARLRVLVRRLPRGMIGILTLYSILVLGLSLYGGTDLMRFVTYFFLPQAVLVAALSPLAAPAEIALMLVATFIFNKLWVPIPIWDMDRYLDFYGGYDSRLDAATLLRSAEILAFVALALVLRRAKLPDGRAGFLRWALRAEASGAP